jgi:hypothetical protein
MCVNCRSRRPLAIGVIGEFAIAALTPVMVVAAARRFVF